jgi:hypothetical protein
MVYVSTYGYVPSPLTVDAPRLFTTQQQRTALDGVVTGRGFAHMESNYGNHFPAGWIWVQAVSQLRDVKLVSRVSTWWGLMRDPWHH